MPDKTAYEHGARALKPLEGPDPNDDFSQKAAENRKPPLGIGLTEKVHQERSEGDKSDLRGPGTARPASDAEGQAEPSGEAGGSTFPSKRK